MRQLASKRGELHSVTASRSGQLLTFAGNRMFSNRAPGGMTDYVPQGITLPNSNLFRGQRPCWSASMTSDLAVSNTL